jgi:2-polyprenyl-3-methyl-5-hydroxy-6-metoxy-1,4-benzoquinol methylase
MSAEFENAEEISDNGERVSHLSLDAGYFAHLSIYDYAVQFCKDAMILDAGSGAGYGSAYLADRGARQVRGIDASAKAIAFSRHHFQRNNLTFQEMSLEHIEGFPLRHFDLIFSSNTLEHVPHVMGFLAKAWSLLKSDGTLLLAVPPITDDRLEYLNLINPYHVNIWSPRQWAHGLGLFFDDITPVLHGVEKISTDFKPEHFTPASTLTEKSFPFAPCTIDDMYKGFTLTAIFVARRPRAENLVPAIDAPPSFVDGSFTRPPGYIDPDIRRRLTKYFEMPAPPYVLPEKPTLARRVKGALRRVRRRLGRS